MKTRTFSDRTWTVLTVAAVIFLAVAVWQRGYRYGAVPVGQEVARVFIIPGYMASEYRQSNFPAWLEGRKFREQREEIRPLDMPSR
jgi:hypothetical protein